MRNRIESFYKHIQALGLTETIKYAFLRFVTVKGKLLPVKVKGLKHPVFLRNKFYDTHIFTQIFVHKELDFPINEPRIIIDSGANIGLATLYFKLKYPDAKIISIEPESSNFKLLELNTKVYSDVELVQKGLWYETTKLFLTDPGEGHAAFRVANSLQECNVIDTIEVISLKSIMKNFEIDHVDLLKIDIEGSEYELFKFNSDEWINNAAFIAVEIHDYLKPGCKALIDNMTQGKFSSQKSGEYWLYKSV